MSAGIQAEAELIREAAAGSAAAFRQLAHRQAESLFRCALAMCHDRELAEELTQETFIAGWQALGKFDGRCRFSTWLYGILRHRFLKSARHARRRTNVEWDHAAMTNLPQSEDSPAVAAEQAEDAVRLRQAMAELPEEHRQVIELRFFAGARLEEIAAALDCPLGTVKSRLHNGLEKLRKMRLATNLFHVSGES